MKKSVIPFLVIAFGAPVPAIGQASHDAVCRADFSDIDFGEVYVRDFSDPQTVGTISVSCISGKARRVVQNCLSLGAGGGGSSPPFRGMRRADGEVLAYQLYADNSLQVPWTEETVPVTLDQHGEGSATVYIYGVVHSSGSEVKGGQYSSSFSAPVDITHRFGEADCGAGGSSTPQPFQVRASVSPHCTVVMVDSMRFGEIGPELANGAEAVASLSVQCTQNAPYSVMLGPGMGPTVTDPQTRQMSFGGQTITYGLYQDPGHSQPWGWMAGQNDRPEIGSGLRQDFMVYGKINPNQSAVVGRYSDSVVVTVQY